MKVPDTCPVEGCDYDDHTDKSDPKVSLRSHISASTDAAHDWQEIKERLTTQETDPSEGSESGDDSDTDDPDDEGADTPDQTPDEGDQDPSDGDDDMPTDEEYQQQHAQSGDGDDSNGDGDSDGGSDDSGGVTLPSAPIDPITLMLLVAVAGVVYVSYRAMTSDGGAETPAEGDPDAGASNPGETSEESNPFAGEQGWGDA